MASALCPSADSFRAIFSVPYLVLTNTIIDPSLVFSSSRNLSYFSDSEVCTTSCLMFCAGEDVASTATRTGLTMYLFDICTIFFGSVAEKSSVCLVFGMNLITRSICTENPMSSIRSVSSSTRKLVSCRIRLPLSR